MENGASSYLRFLDGDKSGFVDVVKEYKDRLTLFINTIIRDIHISEEAAIVLPGTAIVPLAVIPSVLPQHSTQISYPVIQ